MTKLIFAVPAAAIATGGALGAEKSHFAGGGAFDQIYGK
jgi:hypothetical protein